MKALTVYYAPSCAFSTGTVSFLLLRGADFRLVNLDLHPEQRATLEKAIQGKLETPVIEVEGRHHVAPPLSDLKKLLVQWGLQDEAAPHSQLKS